MTPDAFRKLALAIPGAIESEHMEHPDFRIGGKIFASLGSPDENWGMVKLTPDEQAAFIAKDANAFKPCNGAWGVRGYTNVQLASAPRNLVKAALAAASRNMYGKK